MDFTLPRVASLSNSTTIVLVEFIGDHDCHPHHLASLGLIVSINITLLCWEEKFPQLVRARFFAFPRPVCVPPLPLSPSALDDLLFDSPTVEEIAPNL